MDTSGARIDPVSQGEAYPLIELPRQRAPVLHFAVDIGGTLIKIVYFTRVTGRSGHDRRESVDGTAAPSTSSALGGGGAGGRLRFAKFETRHLDQAIEFIKAKGLQQAASTSLNRSCIATGGGAFKHAKLFKEQLGLDLVREDEMKCIIEGANFLLETMPDEAFTFSAAVPGEKGNKQFTKFGGGSTLYPYLLVQIGSGVSLIKVTSPTSHERISGTSLGGGTFWGLCRLLTGVRDFDKMLEMSQRGENKAVDMLVGDIYGSAYSNIGLGADVIASSFGKVANADAANFRKEDIALALLRMISYNIGQIAFMNATQHGLERIFFGGFFIRAHHFTMQTISYAINFWSRGTMQALFLRHEGFLGALGAFLQFEGHEGDKASFSDGADHRAPKDAPAAAGFLPSPGTTPPHAHSDSAFETMSRLHGGRGESSAMSAGEEGAGSPSRSSSSLVSPLRRSSSVPSVSEQLLDSGIDVRKYSAAVPRRPSWGELGSSPTSMSARALLNPGQWVERFPSRPHNYIKDVARIIRKHRADVSRRAQRGEGEGIDFPLIPGVPDWLAKFIAVSDIETDIGSTKSADDNLTEVLASDDEEPPVQPSPSASEPRSPSAGFEHLLLSDPTYGFGDGENVGVLFLEPDLKEFPLLASPGDYEASTIFLNDPADRDYYLERIDVHLSSLVVTAAGSEGNTPEARKKASAFAVALRHHLDNIRLGKGYGYGRLSPKFLFDLREECLREFEFYDAYRLQKRSENAVALSVLRDLIKDLDGMNPRERLWAVIKGALASNLFDWGSTSSMKLYESGSIMDLYRHTFKELSRPFLVDNFDEFAEAVLPGGAAEWPCPPMHKRAVVFVDNAGADIILGMLPLAREFARHGTTVVLAANSMPALNDITDNELKDVLSAVRELGDPVFQSVIDSGKITVVGTGTGSPTIDLKGVSEELASASAGADLVILEGMGRACHSNFHAKFSCDALWLAMLKDRFMAERYYHGKLYDTVCKFEAA